MGAILNGMEIYRQYVADENLDLGGHPILISVPVKDSQVVIDELSGAFSEGVSTKSGDKPMEFPFGVNYKGVSFHFIAHKQGGDYSFSLPSTALFTNI